MALGRMSGATHQASLLGVKIDDLGPEQLVGEILAVIAARSKMIVANVNPHALNLAFEQPWLRAFFNRCEIVFCDGFGVKWGAALLGQTIEHRATPPDWIDLLAAAASTQGASFFLLGGEDGVAKEAGKRLAEKHPGLRVIGAANGYFDKGPLSAGNQAVVATINASKPDILVVAMGMPIQERWLSDNWDQLEVRVAITAGALLDYIAGAKTRPPRLLTDHGLEWAGRLLREPGRLWQRYLIGNPLFIWRLLRQRLGDLRSERSSDFLGVHISPVNMPMALATLDGWIGRRESQYVTVTPGHAVMDAYHDPVLRRIFNASGMTTPDGMSVVWFLKLKGYKHVSRVYGPDLMLALCGAGVAKGYRHFLYGGEAGVADLLKAKLVARIPGLNVCGTYTPPFGDLSADEDLSVVDAINAAAPDVVWVGLSTPQQERWMAAHRGRLQAPVLIGVGAAFDFVSGRKPQAPRWMQRTGLEWLFRLAVEPRRLWPRYRQYPALVFLATLQLLRLRRFGD
jgi:N-acetylglucosaminyldiphosphoundecaprenol N-acetyl-beta-D-mannosaminyltransferase